MKQSYLFLCFLLYSYSSYALDNVAKDINQTYLPQPSLSQSNSSQTSQGNPYPSQNKIPNTADLISQPANNVAKTKTVTIRYYTEDDCD